ncbi:MAG: rubredoxin-like domain-containing protein [Acutalibacteraceae bacterium]|jgi:rubredoxin
MLWKCTVCGYLHAGDAAPEACPKCGVPADKFAALSEEDAQKVITSERTNDIHMQISNLASKIEVLAQEGIDLNLDPPCLTLFKQAKAEARVIKQRSKAEIAGHVGKGKW